MTHRECSGSHAHGSRLPAGGVSAPDPPAVLSNANVTMSQEVIAVLIAAAASIPIGLVAWSIKTIHSTACLLAIVAGQVEFHASELTDHEKRIRSLEREPRPTRIGERPIVN